MPTTTIDVAVPAGASAGESQELKDMIGRLSRIQGQLRGICRMIEEQRPCVEVMQQVSAAESALQRIGSFVFKRHVEHCVRADMASGLADSGQEVGHLLGLVSRLDDLAFGARSTTPFESQTSCRPRGVVEPASNIADLAGVVHTAK